jgi:hypothetical protein
MSEWLRKKLMQRVVQTVLSPFELTNVKCVTRISELPFEKEIGFIVFATSDTLEHGFSRKIFLNNVGGHTNIVYFTTREPKNSLAEQLRVDNTHRDLQLVERYREPLSDQELLEYRRRKELERINESTIADEGEDDDNLEEIEKIVSVQMLKRGFQFAASRRSTLTDYGADIDKKEYAKGVTHAALIDEKVVQAIPLAPTIKSVIEEPEEVPTKLIERERVFGFKATSLYFDFDARTNFFTMKGFLQKCSPAHIIVIGGTLKSTMNLQDVIKQNMKGIVSTPSVLENVFLTLDQLSMKIGLSRALYTRLDFRKVDEFSEISYIDAVLANDDISGLVSARPVEASSAHRANFVGKISIPDLRDKVVEHGMKAVTGQAKLVCGRRKVEVRQVGENTLAMDGVMCADFIRVRNIIQEMLPMV